MHWAEIGVPLDHIIQRLVPFPRWQYRARVWARLREAVQLYMGTMHEERILGGRGYTPPSRTPLSFDGDASGRFPSRKRRTTREDKHMRKIITAAFALSALFAALGKVHAEVNYPWCIIGDTRAVECYFSSREQCMQDGRNRGFGSQCIQNPAYNPGAPTVSGPLGPRNRTVSQTARPSQAVTCTGRKLACLSFSSCSLRSGDEGSVTIRGPYCEKLCNSNWEECMKAGWWQHIGRQ